MGDGVALDRYRSVSARLGLRICSDTRVRERVEAEALGYGDVREQADARITGPPGRKLRRR